MDGKFKNKIKKGLIKLRPKDETLSSKFAEIQSEIRKIQSEIRSDYNPSVSLSSMADDFSISNQDYFSERYPSEDSLQIVGNEDKVINMKCAGCLSTRDLSHDFCSMLENGLFADVKIKCGSENLRAHKCILSARSPVFEAMFNTCMKESVTDTVVVDEIKPMVFRAMLTFMYCGKVEEIDVSLACDLLYAADKYQIETLKKFCVQYLVTQLTNENALQVLEFADLYEPNLKRRVINFVCAQFSAIKQSKQWNDLQSDNPPLALEIYSNIVVKLKQENKTISTILLK